MRPGLWALPAALLMAPLVQVVHTTPAYAANEPVIEVHAPDGAWEGWYRRTVNIQVNASSTFPLALLTWTRKLPDGTTDTGFFDRTGTGFQVSERGATDFTFQATDLFGNKTERKYGVGIDPDAASIDFGAMPTNIVVGQGAVVPFDYSCADALTGVRACTSSVASGQPLATSALGEASVTVRSEDMVGNVGTRKLTYTVVEPLTVTDGPRITGTVSAGSTLTLAGGTVSSGATVTAQWLRDGAPVGTGTTYTLTDDDIGRSIAVRVTGKRQYFRDVQATSTPTADVQPRAFDVTGTLAVRGDAVIGQRLSLGLPTLAPTPTTTTYQWYRNGGAIAGANASTYVVTPTDAGTTLSAGVVLERAAHEPVRQFTGPTAVVLAPLTVERPTTVRGPAIVGRTLASDPPLFSGRADRLAYTWLRDGVPIAGASSTSYRLGAADIGRRITLRVVAQSARRPDAESRSASTAAVSKAAATVKATARARGKARVRVSVKVAASGVTPTGKVTIWRGAKVVARNKTVRGGRVTVNLSRQPRPKVRYKVVYSGSAVVAAKTVVTAKVRVR